MCKQHRLKAHQCDEYCNTLTSSGPPQSPSSYESALFGSIRSKSSTKPMKITEPSLTDDVFRRSGSLRGGIRDFPAAGPALLKERVLSSAKWFYLLRTGVRSSTHSELPRLLFCSLLLAIRSSWLSIRRFQRGVGKLDVHLVWVRSKRRKKGTKKKCTASCLPSRQGIGDLRSRTAASRSGACRRMASGGAGSTGRWRRRGQGQQWRTSWW